MKKLTLLALSLTGLLALTACGGSEFKKEDAIKHANENYTAPAVTVLGAAKDVKDSGLDTHGEELPDEMVSWVSTRFAALQLSLLGLYTAPLSGVAYYLNEAKIEAVETIVVTENQGSVSYELAKDGGMKVTGTAAYACDENHSYEDFDTGFALDYVAVYDSKGLPTSMSLDVAYALIRQVKDDDPEGTETLEFGVNQLVSFNIEWNA